MNQITVIITDDQPIWRKNIRQVLEENNIVTLAEAANGNELLRCLETIKPMVVLLDINMDELDGNLTMNQLSEKYTDLNVLIVSGHGEDTLREDFISRGAKGFITKDEAGNVEDFVSAITIVSAGKLYINYDREAVLKISPKQRVIINLVSQGKTPEEIAKELGVSSDGIRKQLRKIIAMLGDNYLSRFFDGGLRFLDWKKWFKERTNRRNRKKE